MSENSECGSSEYRHLDLLLGQSSTSSFIKDLPSFNSFLQPVQHNIQKCISTSSNSISCDKLQRHCSLCNDQQRLSIHLDEEEELPDLQNEILLPNIFSRKMITDHSGYYLFEQSIKPFRGSCYHNECLPSQHTDEANHISSNTINPNSQTESLAYKDNMSLPFNYSWEKSVGLQEPN